MKRKLKDFQFLRITTKGTIFFSPQFSIIFPPNHLSKRTKWKNVEIAHRSPWRKIFYYSVMFHEEKEREKIESEEIMNTDVYFFF